MANYAYLRVSTDQQDVDNQRHGILEYCNKKDLGNLNFVEDTVSSKKKWYDRKIGDLLKNTMQDGDVLVVSEISRMARSTLQVLEMMELANESNITIHICKQNLVFGVSDIPDMTSTIMATVLAMVAQIEREFISQRTKEALAVRKAQGMKLGRPTGKAKTVKLDAKATTIVELLKKGVNKRAIAKVVECSPSTLYSWIERNPELIKSVG